MDEVFKVFVHFKHQLVMETQDIGGFLAKQYKIHQNSIVFLNPPDEKKEFRIFTGALGLKQYLNKLTQQGFLKES